ncbi:MAG: Uma2 family endonuclease [Elainellaceae cyanobacterium]
MATPAELEYLGVSMPPSQDELPYDDGEVMETQRHQYQMDLLIEGLQSWLDARDDGYVGGNMFVYYSVTQAKNQEFKGPDFFVALGVPKGERKSWVCWEEEKAPDVVIELLFDSTAATDKGEKKLIYERRMHVPEYFWYDPFNPEDWAGFRLQGSTYQPITQEAQGWLTSEALRLRLVRWQGTYRGINTTWLRWASLDGAPLPTGAEVAKQEHQQADQERQRADQERQRADQERRRADQAESQVIEIAHNLLQTGMDAEQVAHITGLAIAEVNALHVQNPPNP